MKKLTYKTHLAAGYTASLLITSPSTLSEMIMCLGISTIGSVISDIDASSSASRKELGKVTAITTAGIIAIFASDLFLGIDIISKFRSSAAIMRLITGFLIFIGICVFGEHQPHRSFMHSLAGVAAVSLSFAVIIPSSAKYMAVSMLSHIALDMLNRKKIQILYPLRKPKIAFGVCYADGFVNHILFYIAGAAAVVISAVKVYGIVRGMM